MNTSRVTLEDRYPQYSQHLRNIIDVLWKRGDTFDIFAELVSSTIWQSPSGLARTWIEKAAPHDWGSLQDGVSDTIEMRRIKYLFRKRIIKECSHLVYSLARNPSFLQRMSTRLAIRDTLATDLDPHDQDRLIASEIHLPHRKWKQLLGALSCVGIPEEVEDMSVPPMIKLDDKGDFSCEIIFDGYVQFRDNPLVGASIDHGVADRLLGSGSIIVLVRQVVSIITVDNAVMMRFDNTIANHEPEARIRNMVLQTMNGLPVWKKKRFWGNSSKKEDSVQKTPAWKPVS